MNTNTNKPFDTQRFHLSRRKLLQYGAGSALGIGLAGSGVPLFGGAEAMVQSAPAAAPRLTMATNANIPADPAQRTLVIVQLSGGNDGLNTVIPITDPQYAKLRPTIKQDPASVFALTPTLSMNGNLRPLFNYWNSGSLAVIEGVEYPQPNFSHFRGTEIWMTGDDQRTGGLGWIGHSLDHLASHPALVAVSLGVTVPQALVGQQPIDVALGGSLGSFAYKPVGKVDPAAISAMYDYMASNSTSTSNPYKKLVVSSHEAAQEAMTGIAKIAAAGYTPAVTYPKTSLAGGLQTVAQMIHGGVGARVLFVSTSGFDTHVTQKTAHDNLLGQFAQASDAFFQDLTAHGHANNVVLMTFSEFGRRPGENASQGTDHGSASVMFVMGPSITGGMFGDTPSLTNLPGGNLVVQQDFRQVYAALLQDWLGFSASDVLPYGPYQPTALFAPRPAVVPTPHAVATAVAGTPVTAPGSHVAATVVTGSASATATPLPQPMRH